MGLMRTLCCCFHSSPGAGESDLCRYSFCTLLSLQHPPQSRKMATPRSSARRHAGAHKSHRRPRRSWNVYVNRSLKAINNNMSMSSRTMMIVNSFVNDIFERVATEAATLVRVNKKRTLGARELQTAVRLVLPAELAKHAMAEGTKAVSNAAH